MTGEKWEDGLSMQPGPSRNSQVSIGERYDRRLSGNVNIAFEPEESFTEPQHDLKTGMFSRM